MKINYFFSFLEHKDDSNVLGEVLSAVYALIVREELCMHVYEEKGLTHVLNAMVNFPDHEVILENNLRLVDLFRPF